MATNPKQQKLDKIAQRITEQNICPELAKNATQLVFGDGNPDADLVFIGEAPGKNEDLQGKPFVGAAGKFLNEMLAMIGLTREDIYITNIVKYRPPNNRDPLPEEKSAFLPFLEEQLEVIKPKLTITLGRHSLNCFLPDLSISQVHGQPKRFKWMLGRSGVQHEMTAGLDAAQGSGEETEQNVHKVHSASTAAADTAGRQKLSEAGELGSSRFESVQLVILPLFHPAAALYNGGMRQTLIDDFANIPLILKKLSNS